MKNKMSILEIFKIGAKNHPGNHLYVVALITFPLAGILNENMIVGLLTAFSFLLLFGIKYILTSFSIGKEITKNEIKNQEA